MLRACLSVLVAVLALWLAVEVIRSIWVWLAATAAAALGLALLVVWLRGDRSPW
jgi:hypothetical protein